MTIQEVEVKMLTILKQVMEEKLTAANVSVRDYFIIFNMYNKSINVCTLSTCFQMARVTTTSKKYELYKKDELEAIIAKIPK